MEEQIWENPDAGVEDEIFSCLDPQNPKSFFLFAGAGSGKTRSLVNALEKIRSDYGSFLRLHRKKIAVITFTNAACDEINRRIDFDSLFMVHTIHSFIWELIGNYQQDIRESLRINLGNEIQELKEELAKSRPGTKAHADRQARLEIKTDRLAMLDRIRKFVYSPVSDNRSRDSLNHTEVIEMGAAFLNNKPLMQEILIRKFPVLFIDESQDTNGELIDAFFSVQKNFPHQFTIGMFGDMMQRIYTNGRENLGVELPRDWLQPEKKMNFRCPKRVIRLLNRLRVLTDGREQEPRPDQIEGEVRLFILPETTPDKSAAEQNICRTMAELTGDAFWMGPDQKIKTLTLEHHMAAARMGFWELFESLSVGGMRDSLLRGDLPGLGFFTNIILPIKRAHQNKDSFGLSAIAKQNCPRLDRKQLMASPDQVAVIRSVNGAVISLNNLWEQEVDPTLGTILENIYKSKLFILPDALDLYIRRKQIENKMDQPQPEDILPDEEKEIEKLNAWDKAMACPFSQLEKYEEYIQNRSKFGTHQGVKGLEFQRVMVILDDGDARGFMFSYGKMFGVAQPTEQDKKNIKDGRETSMQRTLRLFYVSCSRAQKSLAIVAYSKEPKILKERVLAQGWFENFEIIMI